MFGQHDFFICTDGAQLEQVDLGRVEPAVRIELVHPMLPPGLGIDLSGRKTKATRFHLLGVATANQLFGAIENRSHRGQIGLTGFVNEDGVEESRRAGEQARGIIGCHDPAGENLEEHVAFGRVRLHPVKDREVAEGLLIPG